MDFSIHFYQYLGLSFNGPIMHQFLNRRLIYLVVIHLNIKHISGLLSKFSEDSYLSLYGTLLLEVLKFLGGFKQRVNTGGPFIYV